MKRLLPLIIAIILLFSITAPVSADGFGDEVPELPELFGFGGDEERAVLFDLDSGAVLYEKNSSEQARPGSLTVMMTALLLIENTDPADWDSPLPPLKEVNSKWSARGAQMGLKEDDTPTRRDLLYALLLTGAADAAFVTEIIVSGTEAEFVTAMNERARELGMTVTSFDNGYGLGSGSHYTCAADLALLTSAAMKNSLFAQVCSAKEYYCSSGCGGKLLTNTNTELDQEGCIGVKSGSDSEREHCVITAYKLGEARIGAVVLEASTDASAYASAKRLINAGASVYSSEGGLYPYSPTNALFRAVRETVLKDATAGNAALSCTAGESLRVCGASETASGTSICVYRDGRFLWADQSDLEFVCYIDDIFIENGPSLSREMEKGEQIAVESVISTRHRIESVSLTLQLPDGTVKLRRDYTPGVCGICGLAGTMLADSLTGLQLSEGIYTCTLEAIVSASVPGAEAEEIVKRSISLLSVGTGGECVSYNPGYGVNAPNGECFLGEFTIPEETPTRAGFTFAGWNSSPEGLGESFAPGQTVSVEQSLTLYPVWQIGEAKWEVDARATHEGSFMLEGFARNYAGITSLTLTVTGEDGAALDKTVLLRANTAELGTLFMEEPVVLDPGSYTVELKGAAGGAAAETLFRSELTVSKENIATPVPEITPAPENTEPAEKKPFINLAAVPIAVWFVIGAAVVAGLITAIVMIIKRG